MTKILCVTAAVLICILSTVTRSAFPVPADAVPESGVKKIKKLSPANKFSKTGRNPNRVAKAKHNPFKCFSVLKTAS